MGSSRKRSLDHSNHKQVDLPEVSESSKKLKTANTKSPSSKASVTKIKTGKSSKSMVVAAPISDAGYEAPKSKKELRALKKAARKRKAAEEEEEKAQNDTDGNFLSEKEYKEQKQRDKKEQREAMMRELQKQERSMKKIRQQKRLNREKNAPKRKQAQTEESRQDSKKHKKKSNKQGAQQEEQDIAMKALKQVLHGSTDESGMTTTALGVKYKDVVVGTGPEVSDGGRKGGNLVTVRYQLKGGKFKAVLDSSKKFNFRVGKGEVIQGWDIGILGMKVGGRRQLIVPPKAGYGSRDIGAGPGGLLYFDITLLSIR